MPWNDDSCSAFKIRVNHQLRIVVEAHSSLRCTFFFKIVKLLTIDICLICFRVGCIVIISSCFIFNYYFYVRLYSYVHTIAIYRVCAWTCGFPLGGLKEMLPPVGMEATEVRAGVL